MSTSRQQAAQRVIVTEPHSHSISSINTAQSLAGTTCVGDNTLQTRAHPGHLRSSTAYRPHTRVQWTAITDVISHIIHVFRLFLSACTCALLFLCFQISVHVFRDENFGWKQNNSVQHLYRPFCGVELRSVASVSVCNALTCTYIFGISRSNSYIKVNGLRSRLQEHPVYPVCGWLAFDWRAKWLDWTFNLWNAFKCRHISLQRYNFLTWFSFLSTLYNLTVVRRLKICNFESHFFNYASL